MFRYQLYCYNIGSNHDVNMQRLSITKQGQVRYELKTPYRDGTDYRIWTPPVLQPPFNYY